MKRILVVRTDKIGDVVLSLPVVTALRKHFPQAHIAMLTGYEIGPIVENHPDLDEALFLRDESIGEFLPLVRKLRSGRYEAVLVLHPTLFLALAMVCARIPLRVGSGYRIYSPLFNKKVYEHRHDSVKHEVKYNLGLTRVLGLSEETVEFHYPVSEEDERTVQLLLEQEGIGGDLPLVAVHPGSRGSALDWPEEHFDSLICSLAQSGACRVLLTGTEEEGSFLGRFPQPRGVLPLFGRMSLGQLGALLKRVDLLVANSTGPLHIAVALGRPVIGLYPPLRPASFRRWGPFGRQGIVFSPELPECRRCRGSKCSHYNCMKLVSPEKVMRRALEIITKQEP